MSLRITGFIGLLMVIAMLLHTACGSNSSPTAPAPVTVIIATTDTFTPVPPCFTGSSPTCTPTFTYTYTNSFTPSYTPTITNTPTFTLSPTWTGTPTFTRSFTPTGSATPSPSPTSSPTAPPTNTPTPVPSNTPTPGNSPTPSPTSNVSTNTPTPTGSPTISISGTGSTNQGANSLYAFLMQKGVSQSSPYAVSPAFSSGGSFSFTASAGATYYLILVYDGSGQGITISGNNITTSGGGCVFGIGDSFFFYNYAGCPPQPNSTYATPITVTTTGLSLAVTMACDFSSSNCGGGGSTPSTTPTNSPSPGSTNTPSSTATATPTPTATGSPTITLSGAVSTTLGSHSLYVALFKPNGAYQQPIALSSALGNGGSFSFTASAGTTYYLLGIYDGSGQGVSLACNNLTTNSGGCLFGIGDAFYNYGYGCPPAASVTYGTVFTASASSLSMTITSSCDFSSSNCGSGGCGGSSPTPTPSLSPTFTNTPLPTNTPVPTSTPTLTPANTLTPTNTPVNTATFTDSPTNTLTTSPTNSPTATTSDSPTNSPTATPTNSPTNIPTITNTPTVTPVPSYAYSYTLGNSGSGPGSFGGPFGIAVTVSGGTTLIYISDYSNSNIQMYNSSGVSWTVLAPAGTATGSVSNPEGLALDSSGNLYVADPGNSRIQEYSGSSWSVVTGAKATGSGQPGQFLAPSGLAVVSGNLYAADYSERDIQKYIPGTGWSIVGTYPGSEPDGVAGLSPTTILVLDYATRVVYQETSSTWNNFGSVSFGVAPQGVAVDNNGYVFVADRANGVIQVLDSSGNSLTSFGSGQLGQPYGVAVDNLGEAYVADYTNQRIVVFNNVP